jgi:hypothetical protein
MLQLGGYLGKRNADISIWQTGSAAFFWTVFPSSRKERVVSFMLFPNCVGRRLLTFSYNDKICVLFIKVLHLTHIHTCTR